MKKLYEARILRNRINRLSKDKFANNFQEIDKLKEELFNIERNNNVNINDKDPILFLMKKIGEIEKKLNISFIKIQEKENKTPEEYKKETSDLKNKVNKYKSAMEKYLDGIDAREILYLIYKTQKRNDNKMIQNYKKLLALKAFSKDGLNITDFETDLPIDEEIFNMESRLMYKNTDWLEDLTKALEDTYKNETE